MNREKLECDGDTSTWSSDTSFWSNDPNQWSYCEKL